MGRFMVTKVFASLLSLTMVLMLNLALLPVQGAEDLENPVISNFTISETSVNPGDAITISVIVTDDVAVDDSRITLQITSSVGSGTGWIPMMQVGESNTYEVIYTIPSNAFDGDYTIDVMAFDMAGHTSTFNNGVSFNVIVEDWTPPVIDESSCSISITDVHPADEIVIRIDATDNVAVTDVKIQVVQPSGSMVGWYSMTRVDDTDTFEITLSTSNMGSYSIGAYDINFAARDARGYSDDWTKENAFTVTDLDTTAPVIDILSLNYSTNTLVQGEDITVSINVTDDTAVNEVLVDILSPTGDVLDTIVMKRQEGSDTFTATYTIPMNADFGNYTVQFTASDVAGNTANEQSVTTFVVNESIQSVEPILPVVPADPVDPVAPVAPVEPSSPATGDASNMVFYVLLLFSAVTSIVLYRKKEIN
jgi:hypothetical protein